MYGEIFFLASFAAKIALRLRLVITKFVIKIKKENFLIKSGFKKRPM